MKPAIPQPKCNCPVSLCGDSHSMELFKNKKCHECKIKLERILLKRKAFPYFIQLSEDQKLKDK
jgi:hypothetical protein